METTKPFYIPKQLVMEAYKKVKESKGAAGIDGISLEIFEENLKEIDTQIEKIFAEIDNNNEAEFKVDRKPKMRGI